MSTSDPTEPGGTIPEAPTAGDFAQAVTVMSDMMHNLPDAAALERMANEMFRGAARDTATADPTRAMAMPAMHGMPGMPAIPAMPGMPAMPSMASVPAMPAMPAMPGGSFYFLDEAFGMSSVPAVPKLDQFDFDPGRIPSMGLSSDIFDVNAIRRDFPILSEQVHGRRLIWLDNGATTQKPQVVLDRIQHFYTHENSNIHRAAHTLAGRSTDAYEAAREKVRRFLNAPSVRDIVFVRGATEAINLVAQGFGRRYVDKGDEIVVTRLEHHSNIVPWQLLCRERGARLRVAPVDNRGQILLDEYEKLLGPKTRLVAFTHVSNALGTVMPVREMTEMAHRHGARVLIDGAQAVAHKGVDVQLLDCDFYAFSGHKIFAPTGIGVLFGKSDLMDTLPPWQGGGNMISDVTFERTTYTVAPQRFEAGTGNIADAVGLGAALDYLQRIGMDNIARHEHDVMDYMLKELQRTPGIRIIGMPAERAGVVSFLMDGFRPEDVGAMLDREGIAVRAGHHCAQPALRWFGVEATVRPSLALYNTCEDVDALIAALRRIQNGRGVS